MRSSARGKGQVRRAGSASEPAQGGCAPADQRIHGADRATVGICYSESANRRILSKRKDAPVFVRGQGFSRV